LATRRDICKSDEHPGRHFTEFAKGVFPATGRRIGVVNGRAYRIEDSKEAKKRSDEASARNLAAYHESVEKRQSCITKREATQLRRDVTEMRLIFKEHWDVHKILKHQVETPGQNVAVIDQVIGRIQSRSLH